MFDENNQNSACLFAGQSISYLYDEIEPGEKAVFENHLNACSNCADELAEFGFLRTSIVEWKNISFDLLETPEIKIPSNQIISIAKPSFVQSRLKNLREFLTFSPVFAMAAIVLIAICAGLILFVYNLPGNNQTAELETIATPQENISPAPEKKLDVALIDNSNKKPNENSLNISNAENKNFAAPSSSAVEVNNRIVKASNARSANFKNETAVIKTTVSKRNNYNRNTFAIKNSAVKNRQRPKLNNIEEDEEENSLLLADLLDQVGGN